MSVFNMKFGGDAGRDHMQGVMGRQAERRGRRSRAEQEDARQDKLRTGITEKERTAEALERAKAKAEQAGREEEIAAIAAQEQRVREDIEKLKYELRGPDRAKYVDAAMQELQQESALPAYFGHTPDSAGYTAFKQRLEVLNGNINEMEDLVETQENINSGVLGKMRLRFDGGYQKRKKDLENLRAEYGRVLDVNKQIEDRISHLIAIEGSPVEEEVMDTVTERAPDAAVELEDTSEAERAFFEEPLNEQAPSKRFRRFGMLAAIGGYASSLFARRERPVNESDSKKEDGKKGSGIMSGLAKNRRLVAAMGLVGLLGATAKECREDVSSLIGSAEVENPERLTDAERAERALVESLPDGTQRILIPDAQGNFEGESSVTRVAGESFSGARDFYPFALDAKYTGAGEMTVEGKQNLAFDMQHEASVGTVQMLGAIEAAAPDLDMSLVQLVVNPDIAFGPRSASPEGNTQRNLDSATDGPRFWSVFEAGVQDGLEAYGIDSSNLHITYEGAQEQYKNVAEIFDAAKDLGIIDAGVDADSMSEEDQQTALNKIVREVRTPKTNEVRKKYQGDANAEQIVELLNSSRGLEGFSVTFPDVEIVRFGEATEVEQEADPDTESDSQMLVEILAESPIEIPKDSIPSVDEVEEMLALARKQSPEPNAEWRAQQESAEPNTDWRAAQESDLRGEPNEFGEYPVSAVPDLRTSEVPDERTSPEDNAEWRAAQTSPEPNADWRAAQTSEVPDERTSPEDNAEWRAAQESPRENFVDAADATPDTFRDPRDGKLMLGKIEAHVLQWVGERGPDGSPDTLFQHAIGLDPAVKQDILTGILEDMLEDKDMPAETMARVEMYFDLLTIDPAGIEELPVYVKNNQEFLREFAQLMAAETADKDLAAFSVEDTNALVAAIDKLKGESNIDATALELLENKLLRNITSRA